MKLGHSGDWRGGKRGDRSIEEETTHFFKDTANLI